MSKMRNLQLAAVGQIFRDGRQVLVPKCAIPGCPNHLEPGKHPHGLCPKHEDMLEFLLFVLPRIQTAPASGPDGLVLPGQPDFRPPGVIAKGG